MLRGKKVGLIGLGNMGKALLNGFLQSEVILPEDIKIFDKHELCMRQAHQDENLYATSVLELVRSSEIVVIAVKPQDMQELLLPLSRVFRPDHLLISIAAGINTQKIEGVLEQRVPVVRVMPNLPVVVGTGASAYCLGSFASWPHGVVANILFSSVGKVVDVGEDQMDTVTALSGSGPAYVFLLAELLTEAASRQGLPKEVAQYLATQTLLGGAEMLHKSRLHPSYLRSQVTSPNGTTEAALKVFEEEKLMEVICKGVSAARKRSQELSEELSLL